MTGYIFLQLVITTLVPATAAILLHFILKKVTKFKNLNFWIQQLIIGVIFAGLTIGSFYFGPEYRSFTYGGFYKLYVQGTYGTATAVPLISGLLFGWPSGIIAGVIAAIYRSSVSFGASDFLRFAEAAAVLVSGLLALLLRKVLFNDKKPKWLYGIPIGLLSEVIHMSIIFLRISLDKRGNVYYGYGVVAQADVACAISVSLTLVLAILGISLIERDNIRLNVKSKKISVKIQKWLGITFAISLIFATGSTVLAFTHKQRRDNLTNITNSLRDVECDFDKLTKDDINNHPEKIRSLFHYRRVGEEGLFIVVNKDDEKIVATCIETEENYGYKDPEKKEPIICDYTFRFADDKKLSQCATVTLDSEHKYVSGSTFVGRTISTPLGEDAESKHVCVCHVYTQKEANKEYYICAMLPYDEAIINAGLSIRVTVYLEIIIFIAIFTVIYLFLKKVVIKNIHQINKDLSLITQGDLDVVLDVRANEEFASLSDDINRTVDTLKRYIDEANKRIDKELAFAKEIQHSALPTIFPNSDNFDLYALMDTAKEVGGDFYDFFPVGENKIMISIADVSGKGIPASLFMMRAKTLVKSLVDNQEYKLNDVIAHVNNELCTNNAAGMFVTGWFGILNAKTGVLEFTNAGHNSPLIKQKGKFRYLDTRKNLVLAGMPNTPYNLEKIKLKPSDEIFLYTDGVTEATSKRLKLYSDARLLKLVNSIKYKSSKDFLDKVKADVDKFQKGAVQADDITMLALRYKPNKKHKK